MEIVGYEVCEAGISEAEASESVKVAMTESCIKASGIDVEGIDYLQYIDAPVIEVVVSGKKLYLYADCIAEDESMPDKVDSFNAWVDGYCFNKYSGVDLDNDYAIREYLVKTGDK